MRGKTLAAYVALLLLLSGCTVRVAGEAGLFRDPPQPKAPCPVATPSPTPRFVPEPPDGGAR